MLLQIISVLVLMITAALCAPGAERQNMRLARDDKPQERPQSSGTLDPIGGGNLVRVVDDRDLQEQLSQSLERGEIKKEGVRQNMARLARDDKPQKPSQSSGTLDSIGGGHLLRAVDPYRKEQVFRSLDIGERENDGERENMRLARNDKPPKRPQSSGTLDSLGGGNLLRATDPYWKDQLFKSLEFALLDSVDNYRDREVLRTSDALMSGNLLSSLDVTERMAVIDALKTRSEHSKRMLDNVSGRAFGESERNFDEIDNVGFVGWAKQSPPRQTRYHSYSIPREK